MNPDDFIVRINQKASNAISELILSCMYDFLQEIEDIDSSDCLEKWIKDWVDLHIEMQSLEDSDKGIES